MSNSATRSRAAWGSAPTIGDQCRAAQSSGDGTAPSVEQRGVGLVPLRALPAVGLEEVARRAPLRGVEGAAPQRPRLLRRLQRVDDVVDLEVVLGAARRDVRRGELVRLEAVESHSCRSKSVTPSTSHSAIARPTPAEWVTQTASGDPEAAARRPTRRAAAVVGGEGEQAVERLVDSAAGAARAAAPGLVPGPAKCSAVNGAMAGMTVDAARPDRLGLDQQRRVAVGADAVAVAVLAEVHRAVLVAQDRVRRPRGVSPARSGSGVGVGVLVLATGVAGWRRRPCARPAGPRCPRRSHDVLGRDPAAAS